MSMYIHIYMHYIYENLFFCVKDNGKKTTIRRRGVLTCGRSQKEGLGGALLLLLSEPRPVLQSLCFTLLLLPHLACDLPAPFPPPPHLTCDLSSPYSFCSSPSPLLLAFLPSLSPFLPIAPFHALPFSFLPLLLPLSPPLSSSNVKPSPAPGRRSRVTRIHTRATGLGQAAAGGVRGQGSERL